MADTAGYDRRAYPVASKSRTMPTKATPRTAAKVNGILTEKEALFIEYYLGPAAGNGARAAKMAGYSGNENTFKTTAAQILSRPRVIGVIQEYRDKRTEKLLFGANDVLYEMMTLLAEVKSLGPARTPALINARRAVIEKLGEHIDVGAFRRQVGLSSPTGGPIETVDAYDLATLSDEELGKLDAARAILDRHARTSPHTVAGTDQPGAGTPPDSD
jgi:hypothetical protein